MIEHRPVFRNLLFIPIVGLCIWSVLFIRGFTQGTPEEEAQSIIDQSGVQGGLIVHLYCGDGLLTEALQINDRFLVHGLSSQPESIQNIRQYLVSKNKYGAVSVDHLTGNRLPYRDNLVNLIVTEDLDDISMDEVMRVLAPNGVLMVKGTLGWGKTVKPRPAGMDEWNHYLYNAAGNAVSKDETISP